MTSELPQTGPHPSDGDRPVRLACVDDDTLIREGVLRLLDGVSVSGAYSRVDDFLEGAPDVDVVLLDLWLPALVETQTSLQGVRAVSAAVAAGYRVLIYTNENRRDVLAGCLAAGAHGIVHKSEPLEAVVAAARGVAAGHIVITTALAGLAEVVQRRGSMPTLSPRQLDVLGGRARGESFKSIGARLYISPKTAEEYMSEVSRRFASYLRDHSPADLERLLGIGPGDLLDPHSGTGRGRQ